MRLINKMAFVIVFIALLITPVLVIADSGGFDEWGYNYQAHIFNGYYCDAYKDAAWCQPYADVKIVMKWNDAWLSNKDRDGDGSLDRHYGFTSYIGSGAWETNHMWGTYIGEDGLTYEWDEFYKIVAKPTSDYICAENGGYEIWGEFCVVQDIYNDPYSGFEGNTFPPGNPGFGTYK